MEKSPNSPPEFEFWISQPQHFLLTADQLFADGVILPLNNTTTSSNTLSNPNPPPPSKDPSPLAPLKLEKNKWKQIFRKPPSSVGTNAELNINIWPFARSRSSGSASSAARPRASVATCRKSCSAPCSRSNSHGDSSFSTSSASKPAAALKKFGQLTGGVHVGRSTLVLWRLKRKKSTTSNVGGTDNVLNLNVNSCIGYGISNTSPASGSGSICRGKDKGEAAGDGRSNGGSGNGNRRLLKIRAMFSKKVY